MYKSHFDSTLLTVLATPRYSKTIIGPTRFTVSAPLLVWPLLVLLKSGTVLKAVGVVSKLSLVLAATLRFSGKRVLTWWHGEYHPPLQPQVNFFSSSEKKDANRHFRRTTLLLVFLPFGLFGAVILASLEPAPIWGRWRVIAMSSDEEQEILYEVLRPGLLHAMHSRAAQKGEQHLQENYDRIASQNWLAILRSASGDEEEGNPLGSFSGYRVVNGDDDWRVRWVSEVLQRLDYAVAISALSSADRIVATFPKETNPQRAMFHVPPVKYSLSMREALRKRLALVQSEGSEEGTNPLIRHGNVIIDAPICNVCSIGFGTSLKERAKSVSNAFGIVIVTTGELPDDLNCSPTADLIFL